jgi:GntR family transcriptional regulator, gluconate operon transcriptional repressor
MTTAPAPRLIRTPSFGDQVAEVLRDRIVGGELASGTHLVEEALGEEFGVSRVPIRDALKQLQVEGLAETRRKGSYVAGLTHVDVRELYSIRGAIESLAIRQAMAGRDVDWSLLENAQAELEASAAEPDRGQYTAADLRFHSAIYELSGNSRLKSLWQGYLPIFRSMLRVTNRRDADLEAVTRAHRDVVDAARAGDVERTVSLVVEHIDHAAGLMEESLASVWSSAG